MSANSITAFAHYLEIEMNPERANKLEQAQEAMTFVSNIAQIALIAGVALSVLGALTALTSAANPVAIIPATFFTLGGLALSYVSFNAHHIAENIKKLLSNPRRCATWMGLGSQIDGSKLRDLVRTNTFACDWVINAFIREGRREGVFA